LLALTATEDSGVASHGSPARQTSALYARGLSPFTAADTWRHRWSPQAYGRPAHRLTSHGQASSGE